MQVTGLAMIDHHFDMHSHYSASQCKKKTCNTNLKQKNDSNTANEHGKYRSISIPEENKMHHQIHSIFKKFLIDDQFKECLYPFDSQKNEAINNCIISYTPKNKVHGISQTCKCRVKIAISCSYIGKHKFWARVFSTLQLPLLFTTFTQLERIEKILQASKECKKKHETKWKRQVKVNAKLLQETAKTAKSRKQSHGSSISFKEDKDNLNTKKKICQPKHNQQLTCKSYHLLGYGNKRSQLCCLNILNINAIDEGTRNNTLTAQAKRDIGTFGFDFKKISYFMESHYKYFCCAVNHKILFYDVEDVKEDIEFLDNISLSNGEKSMRSFVVLLFRHRINIAKCNTLIF